MDIFQAFVKSKKDLESKSPAGYIYEIEVRLRNVIREEFHRSPKIKNAVTTEEILYSVKGSSTITVR